MVQVLDHKAFPGFPVQKKTEVTPPGMFLKRVLCHGNHLNAIPWDNCGI